MWILAKLALAAAVFCYRFIRGGTSEPPETNGTVDGLPFEENLLKHKGSVYATVWSFPLKSACLFGFNEERWYDRIAKSLGIATEIQTGKKEFDKKIYIASDSRTFAEKIRADGEICELIFPLFDENCESITGDSECLDFRFKKDRSSEERLKSECAKIAKKFGAMNLAKRRPFDERFFMRALIVETLVWSIATYAATGVLEIFVWKTDYFRDWTDLFGYGCLFALGFLVLPLAISILFMRGSSRGHRIVIEAAAILFISSAAAGFEAAADLNMAMDKSQPVVFDLKINRAEEVITRGRKGQKHYHYYVYLQPEREQEGLIPPQKIEVAYSEYTQAFPGGTLRLTMKNGWLGAPWYKSLEFRRGEFGL